MFPFIGVWDDHEAADNSFSDGAENHTEATEGPWATRRAIAQRVYTEWEGKPNAEGGGTILNPDQWDGYAAARQRLFDLFRTAELRNVVILSGDIHSSGAADVSEDPNNSAAYDPATGAGSLAVEFVTPGVTSPSFGPGSNQSVLTLIKAQNPHIKYADVENRGYCILDVTRAKVRATWYHFTRVDELEATEQLAAVYATLDGTHRVVVDA